MNKLKVKESNFQTDLTFNEWAKKYQVSVLVPIKFDNYERKLDSYNESEKLTMIRSIYEGLLVSTALRLFLGGIIQLIINKTCQEKTN